MAIARGRSDEPKARTAADLPDVPDARRQAGRCGAPPGGFSISAARQINKAFTARGGDRRTGKVFTHRYHARPLTSPRAVRTALSYCLSNFRHHGEDLAPCARTWKVDPFSSGALYPGWREVADSPFFWPLPAAYQPLIVFRPRTWLLSQWDRFHEPLSYREIPGGA